MPTSARAAEKWLQFLCIRWYALPLYSLPSSSMILSTSSSVKSVVPKAMDSLVKNKTQHKKTWKDTVQRVICTQGKENKAMARRPGVRHWHEYPGLSERPLLTKWHTNILKKYPFYLQSWLQHRTSPESLLLTQGKSQLHWSACFPLCPQPLCRSFQ